MAKIRLIKIADEPLDLLDRSYSNPEEFENPISAKGCVFMPSGGGYYFDFYVPANCTTTTIYDGDYLLTIDGGSWVGIPRLVSGQATMVTPSESGLWYTFYLFKNAVISGDDSEPRTGIYVLSISKDNASEYIEEVPPIMDLAYLPYEKVLNKIPEKYLDITIPGPPEPMIVEFEIHYGDQYRQVYPGYAYEDVIRAYFSGTPIIGKCPITSGNDTVMLFTRNIELVSYSGDDTIDGIQFYFDGLWSQANIKLGDTYIDTTYTKQMLYIEWNSSGTFFSSWQLVPYDDTRGRSKHNTI